MSDVTPIPGTPPGFIYLKKYGGCLGPVYYQRIIGTNYLGKVHG